MLRDRIIRGDIAPGARISETEIAAEYAVSRQPVREAFIKLSEEALVEVRPQRGTYVSLISVQAVMTARFIREAVEADVVRGVAETVDAAGLDLLEAQIAEQRALPPDAPGTAFMQLDDAFHRTLAALAGQGAVADYLEGLKTQLNRVRHISARPAGRARLIAQHAAVVAGLRRRDADGSVAAMRVHLREILADLPEIIAARPDFFDEAAAP
jgi:DNA-binding GntR family transcriptional regulator